MEEVSEEEMSLFRSLFSVLSREEGERDEERRGEEVEERAEGCREEHSRGDIREEV